MNIITSCQTYLLISKIQQDKYIQIPNNNFHLSFYHNGKIISSALMTALNLIYLLNRISPVGIMFMIPFSNLNIVGYLAGKFT